MPIRRPTRQVTLGDDAHGRVRIGGDAPVSVQTMTSGYTHEDRLYLLKLDQTTGALSVDDTFRDTDGQTGFSFAEREWPHGWKGQCA